MLIAFAAYARIMLLSLNKGNSLRICKQLIHQMCSCHDLYLKVVSKQHTIQCTREADCSCFLISKTSRIKRGCSCRAEHLCCHGNGKEANTRRPKAQAFSRETSTSVRFPCLLFRKKCTLLNQNRVKNHIFFRYQVEKWKETLSTYKKLLRSEIGQELHCTHCHRQSIVRVTERG